jgi:hypothetical protein
MPRRELLTSAQREALLAFPREEAELLRHYTFNTHDFAVIRRCRGNHNRLVSLSVFFQLNRGFFI